LHFFHVISSLEMKNTKHFIFFGLLLLAVVVLFVFSLMYGSVSIPFESVTAALNDNPEVKKSWLFIVQEVRFPKAITAIVAGGGLALSGLLMQTLFRNPLAGPYVLGISNGASLGVALLVLSGGSFLGFQADSSWAMILMAIGGSGIVLAMVLAVSARVQDNLSLLIIGIMIGSITGAVVSVLQFYSNPEDIQAYLAWTFGSLSGVTWDQLTILVPVVLIGVFLAFISQKKLNTLLLGNQYAQGLGISVKQTRITIILATCLMAGGVTAFAGPIAFLGLAVPHIARAILQTSDHKILIPAVVLIGAILLLICDIVAQLPGNQNTLPLNAVTAMIGAPVVIWVVLKSKMN